MPDPITTWVTATCQTIAPVPSAVQVHETVNTPEILVIEIRPDPRNAGQIMGRGGEAINAIRRLAVAMCRMQAGHRSLLIHVVSEVEACDAVVEPGSHRREP